MSAVPSALPDDLLPDGLPDDALLHDGLLRDALLTSAPQAHAAPSHIAPTDATVIPLTRPRRRLTESVPTPLPALPGEPAGVPCAARPSTGFRHLDGPCECFFGGPAPVFPAAFDPAANA